MNSPKLHYNCLGCPQCSSPLHDPLFVLEQSNQIKTVKCENCDFIGYRSGWELLTKEQQNNYVKIQKGASISDKTLRPVMDDTRRNTSTIRIHR